MIGSDLPEWVIAKLLVIVEVFVSGSDGEDALSEERALGMSDEVGVSRVRNDSVESVDESKLSIGFAEQKDASVGGDGTAGEVRDDVSSSSTGKGGGRCVTVCHSGGSREGLGSRVVTTSSTNT